MSLASFYRKACSHDKAVYWPPSAETAQGGRKVGTAVEINCRWDDVMEEFVDMHGDEQISSAKLLVDTVLEFGGVLWHGKLVDAVTSDPNKNKGAREIRKIETVPGMKNEFKVRIIYL